MKNTADVTSGKPIAVIHGGKREVLLFYFVPDTTPDIRLNKPISKIKSSRIIQKLSGRDRFLAIRPPIVHLLLRYLANVFYFCNVVCTIKNLSSYLYFKKSPR
jgi:hypothetical protein